MENYGWEGIIPLSMSHQYWTQKMVIGVKLDIISLIFLPQMVHMKREWKKWNHSSHFFLLMCTLWRTFNAQEMNILNFIYHLWLEKEEKDSCSENHTHSIRRDTHPHYWKSRWFISLFQYYFNTSGIWRYRSECSCCSWWRTFMQTVSDNIIVLFYDIT